MTHTVDVEPSPETDGKAWHDWLTNGARGTVLIQLYERTDLFEIGPRGHLRYGDDDQADWERSLILRDMLTSALIRGKGTRRVIRLSFSERDMAALFKLMFGGAQSAP